MASYVSSADGGGYPQNPVTVSGHSLAAGDDRIVLAGIALLGPDQTAWDGDPAYGGVTMNLLRQETVTYYGRELELYVFYLLEGDLPSDGANSLTYESGSGPYGSHAIVASYEDCAQDDPPADAGQDGFSNPPYSGGTAHTTNITAAASSGLLVDFFAIEATGGVIDVGTGQTDRDTGGSGPYINLSDKSFSSSGSNSMEGEPQSTHDSFSHIIVELADLATGEESMMFGCNF